MPYEKRDPRKCSICGKRLTGKYYWMGRCAKHQTAKNAEANLTGDASAAKAQGLSYGQYMALKSMEVEKV